MAVAKAKKETKVGKHAVIRLKGRQHVVVEGQTLSINRLPEEVGAKVEAEVLFISDGKKAEVGAPSTAGKASLEILEHKKGKKISGMKFKAKSRYRRRYGHRQSLSVLEVKKLA